MRKSLITACVLFSLCASGLLSQEAAMDSHTTAERLVEAGLAIHIGPGDSIKVLLEAHGTVTFISRRGELYCMDSDTVITFNKNGTVELVEMGLGSKEYKCTFKCPTPDTVELSLPKYPGKWAVMKFGREGKDCLLTRNDGEIGFIRGGRTGSFISDEMHPFWPFALLPYQFKKNINQAVKPIKVK